MASYRANPPVHGRIHRRGNSGSTTSPPLPSTMERPSMEYSRVSSRKNTYDDARAHPAPPNRSTSSGSSLKIKPYLRKLSFKDGNSLDLSRPAAENQSLAGLGIHDFGGSSRSVSDVTFAPVGPRGKHHRSTSNNSQFSTTSSLQRPTAPYAHPMRQTPRPYTPPIAKSYTTSVTGSEGFPAEEAMDILSDEDFCYRQYPYDAGRRSDSLSSAPTIPPLLHIHTGGSLTRLGTSNLSSTSIPSTQNLSRSRGATLGSVDTMSPVSRTSMDKAMGFIRGQNDPVDASARADAIRAARIKYNEREAEKERKAEKEALKQQGREFRKRVKQEDRQRRKSDADDQRPQARAGSSNEKLQPLGREYSNFAETPIPSLPATVQTGSPASKRARPQAGRSSRSMKSTWVGFVAWFKTRLLRLSRKMGMR